MILILEIQQYHVTNDELYIFCFQLACDLNPTPITEGNGFDYNQIMQRAARNIEESKTAGGEPFSFG